jgi:hypothetical protein
MLNSESFDLTGLEVRARRFGVVSKIVNVTTTPLTVVQRTHEGKIVTFNLATGVTATLPACSGSGDVYTFIMGTAAAGGSTIVKVANASDIMTGRATVSQDAADTVVEFETTGTSDTITFNASTTGGGKGSKIVCTDIGANLWHVEVDSLTGTGAEATPFSATV